MNRREFIKLAGGAMVATVAGDVLLAAQPKPPMNLLFITADDLDASTCGWMEGGLKLTPRMDDFAATCHRFVNNRAASPICQPSRQAMMTGLVPHRSGGYGFNPVRPATSSLATILKSSGYFIAAVNKITHMAPKSVFPWDLSFDGSGKNPDTMAKNFAACLKAAKDATKPFFINCNITDPHRPFYGSGPDGGPPPKDKAAPQGMLARELKSGDAPVPAFLENIPGVQKEFAQYCNSVQRMDVTFGKLLDTLESAGETGRTAIVFVSDHGMPFPFAKATVFNAGPWTPALLRWPGMDKPQVRQEFTGSIDLMPTLLELLGGAIPPDIDGRSWLPLLRGEKQPDRDFVISHVNTLSNERYLVQRLVQSSGFALCFAPWADGKTQYRSESMMGLTWDAMSAAGKADPRLQPRLDQYLLGTPLALFDMQNDPAQRVNVINDPKFRDDREKHQQILLAYMERTKDPELDNFKRLLAGKPVDVESSEKFVKAEQKELRQHSGDSPAGD